MKKINQLSLIIIAVVIVILISGCDSIIPVNPGEEYDEENTILEYIRVIPGKVDMAVNQSQKFELKGYNSENRLIAMDPSLVKWVATHSCGMGMVVWNLSPKKGSLQTTFTPLEAGNYKIWVNYDGKWARAEVSVVK